MQARKKLEDFEAMLSRNPHTMFAIERETVHEALQEIVKMDFDITNLFKDDSVELVDAIPENVKTIWNLFPKNNLEIEAYVYPTHAP